MGLASRSCYYGDLRIQPLTRVKLILVDLIFMTLLFVVCTRFFTLEKIEIFSNKNPDHRTNSYRSKLNALEFRYDLT